jgi:hypothetical protein
MSVAAGEAVEAGAAQPFSRVVALAVAGIGIAAFAAFLVFGAFAPDTDRDLRGGSALSDSAVGFAGIVELLRAQGVPVTVSRVAPRAGRSGLLVLTPSFGTAAIGSTLLADRAGPVLVVLPKWRVQSLKGHPGWVESDGLLGPGSIDHLMPVPIDLDRIDGPHRVLHGGTGSMEKDSALPIGALDPIQVVDVSANWAPVLLTEQSRPVLLRWSGHRVYLLADPDILDTRGLATPEGAATALQIIDALRAGGPVTLDVTLNGFTAPPNLLRLLFVPPLLGATLCATAAALLVLLIALHRFGPVARPDRVHEFGKRALADNSAGLIALAGREPRMALPYAQLLRGQALRGLGASHRLDAAAADRLLDAAARTRGLDDSWTTLAGEAGAAHSRAALVAVAAKLYRWRKGMTRDDR